MVGTKVQKPNSGRLKSKPTNSIFKGTLSPMRPPGKSLIGTKNEYTQYQTMQTPLALRARNPDKAQNTNRMIAEKVRESLGFEPMALSLP